MNRTRWQERITILRGNHESRPPEAFRIASDGSLAAIGSHWPCCIHVVSFAVTYCGVGNGSIVGWSSYKNTPNSQPLEEFQMVLNV